MITQLSFFGTPKVFCQRCGRPLTNPKSIEAHKGPICRGHSETPHDPDTDFVDFSLQETIDNNGIVLKRDERGNVWTNVPHLVTHHSPTGFEFGYGGSGPADLALNICEVLLNHLGYKGERTKCFDGDCWTLAFQIHQEFKNTFLSFADDHTVIPYQDAMNWVKAKAENETL